MKYHVTKYQVIEWSKLNWSRKDRAKAGRDSTWWDVILLCHVNKSNATSIKVHVHIYEE